MSIGTGCCCVDCKTYYVPTKNDIIVLETMENGDDYKLWSADLMTCPNCKKRLITGFGSQCVSEHYHDDFKHVKECYLKAGILFTMDGCPAGTVRWDGRTN